MAVVISLLRGVNLAGHNRIKMDALRTLYESLGLRDVQTYVQSGNVVFRTGGKTVLEKKIEDRIEGTFGFRPAVVHRTCAEMREIVAANPFAGRTDIHPAKLLVVFLAGDPGAEARENVGRISGYPEEVRLNGRELYIYYPNGAGRPTMPASVIGRAVKVEGTARNWNTVTKLLEMAQKLERRP
jgi:uncharacterized protein (DUF1697 family)